MIPWWRQCRVWLALEIAAFWPVWRWYALRLRDGSDDAIGIVALAVLVMRGLRAAWKAPVPLHAAWWSCGLLAVYCAGQAFLPPLASAAIAMAALAALLGPAMTGSLLHPAPLGLLWLALPVHASLQFFTGYPLRVVTAQGAAMLLRGGGWAVSAAGAELTWNGSHVAVDAACSGVRMFWTGYLALFALCCWRRVSARATLYGAMLTVPLLLLANMLRAASVFYLESGILQGPAWLHEGIGVVVFAGVVAALAGWVHWRERACVCSSVM